MDPSPPALSLLLTLVLGFTQATQANDQVDYCQGICPDFTRTSTNGTYEVREYEASDWMCSDVESASASALLAAKGRLELFRSQQSTDLNVEISDNTWPVMVSVKQVDSGEAYELCWFIPPGLTLTSQDPVTVVSIPKTTMFVRSYTGLPSFGKGEENAQELKADLLAADKKFNRTIYYGLAYESYFSFWHHDEIWIREAS